MPKRGAEARVGNEDSSGHGVYGFIGDLIREGKDAKFVNKKGRYVLNWSSTLERYAIYKSKKNPQFKSKNINRRKASNGLRAALLNIYKKDGAKEYKESKKINDKDEVIERQFQMPPKVFQSLFGSKVELSDDSDHETSSTSSEADEKLQASPDVSGSPDTSDTGFEEAMDVSDDLLHMNATGTALQDNIKREDPVDLTNIETPSQIFGISAEDLDSALEEICTNSDNDVDQPGVVQDVSPSSGSVKGGIQFHIMLTEALLESDTRGVAHFDGVGDVFLEKTNPYTFSGFVPAAQEAGPVLITVYTEAGQKLGITYFMYVDEMRETLKQLIKDPAQLSLFLTMWSQAHGIIGSNSDIAQTLSLFGLPDQGPLPDAQQGQSLKVLQLLVYTAAQEDAQQFLQMIFSTSAGKIVFDSYKDRTPLPEDVARANGHDKLAEFLQDVNKRLSEEHDSNSVALGTSDWLELVQAVDNIQKQTVSNGERESSRMQPKDDDNQSDYFADAETSSCGSLELIGDWSDLEEENGACTKDEDCENAAIETGIDNCASLLRYPQEEHLRISLGFSEENEATEESFEDETQLGNGKDNIESPSICEESSVVNFPAKIKLRRRSSFFSLPIGRPALFSRRKEISFLQAEEMGSVSQKKGTERRDDSDSEHKYATESLRQEKTTELYTSREGFLKNSSRFSEENAATEESFEDEAVFGNCQDDIESPSICEESPVVNFPAYKRLPLLRSFFQWLSRREDDLSAEQQDVCSLQAERMGSVSQNKGTKRRDDGGSRQKYAAESSRQEKTTKSKKHRQRGHWIKFETASRVRYILLTAALVTVLAGIKLGENQILHWAVGNGYTQFSKLLLKCGLNVDAPNSRMQTPLHIAAKFGFIGLTDVLTKLGGNVDAKSYQQQTPLHLAVWNGHQQIAAMLLQRGSDSQRGDVFGRTPAHLAAIQGQEQMLKMLILTQRGSALKARDNFGRTPLHLASVKGIERLVELLIRHGSDLSARDNSQKTALHLAAESGQDTIVHSLIMHGGDIQDGDLFGQTPLHLAAQTGRNNVVKLLLELGSIVGAVNVFKQTPLHLAAESGENGYKDILKELIQHGSDVNAANIFGQTALHLASRKGHNRIVEVLVQHKSQVSALDNSRKTALDCAVESGHQEIVEFLDLSSRRGKSRSLGSLTRVQRDVNMNYISKQTPLQIRQGPLQVGIPKNGSNEFNGNKHRSTINASSLSPSFHTTIPSDPITSSSKDSYVCVPHDCRKYSRLYFNLLPPFLVACKQRRGVKRDEYNLELISSKIPICSQKHMQVLKKKLQQACHYRKPDIDRDVSSGRSFLEHFGPIVFNLSCIDLRQGHKCSGCFVADEARGRPKRVLEQDENIRYYYAECDLEFSTNFHEFVLKFVVQQVETFHPSEQCGIDGSRQPDIKPRTLLSTQCYSAWKRLIHSVGTSSGPNLSISCLVNHHMKDSDSKVIKQFSAENEGIQPFTNSSQEERACKENGRKVWTLACKTENATGRREASKHLLISIVIGLTFIATIILLLTEQRCFKNYFAKFLFNSPKPRRNNRQKEPANTEIGWSAYISAFKTENAGGERQVTYHETNRVKHLLVTIHFAIVTLASFIVTCICHIFAKMFPKFTDPKPSSATFIIRPTSKPPTSTNSSNDINWLPWKNDPLDRHKQSKRRNQQTMQKGKGKQET